MSFQLQEIGRLLTSHYKNKIKHISYNKVKKENTYIMKEMAESNTWFYCFKCIAQWILNNNLSNLWMYFLISRYISDFSIYSAYLILITKMSYISIWVKGWIPSKSFKRKGVFSQQQRVHGHSIFCCTATPYFARPFHFIMHGRSEFWFVYSICLLLLHAFVSKCPSIFLIIK